MPMRLATMRIGAVDVGVAVEAVLQALPATGLAALARRRGALCGVVEHDGCPVPVVDLARWVDVGSKAQDAAQNARVVLLRDGARRIGLRVDAVGGLAEADTDGMHRLCHDEDPEEVFHTVAKARGTDTILNVLDTGRLAALALAWHEDGAAGEAGPVGVSDPLAQARAAAVTMGVLQAGGLRIALPAADVAEVLPMPALRDAGIGMTHCAWQGRTLAVLPATTLGGDSTGRGRALLAVVERDGLALGLPVDAALGMQAIALDVEAPPAAEGLASVSHDEEGRALLLLDVAALFARFPEAALARRQAGTVAAPAAGAQRSNASAYIVFEADGMLATPIEALEEILPLPPAPAVDATMTWRGKTVALTDLRPAAARGSGQVMVVRRGARHVACVVTHVSLLVPPRGGRLYRMGAGPRAVEFITVGEGAAQASYRTVDVAALAA